MDLGLKGKKVLIVGLGNGIGKSIAQAFVNEGAIITLLSRDENKMKTFISRINDKKKMHSYIVTDLMIPNKPKEIVQTLITQNNYFDIVIHNIGGHMEIRDPLAPIEDWLYVWRLNIGIAIELNNYLVPIMINRNWGRIIHISSISAKTLRGSPQYCSSKAYLNAYVTNVGRIFAEKGIVICSVMPGAIEFKGGYWEKIKETNKEKYFGFIKEHQAIGRMGMPDEIASFVLFMGSIHSTFAPAANIPVDGASM